MSHLKITENSCNAYYQCNTLKIKVMFWLFCSKPSRDTMADYVRRIMFLKGIIETHKLVSQLYDICM